MNALDICNSCDVEPMADNEPGYCNDCMAEAMALAPQIACVEHSIVGCPCDR